MRSTVSTTRARPSVEHRPGDLRHELPGPVSQVAEKIRSTPTTLIGPDGNGNYTTSAPEAGGYQRVNGQLVPGPVLSSALDYVDAQLGRMVSTIHKDGLAELDDDHRHGKARPVAAGSERTPHRQGRPDHQRAINAAWAQTHPSNTSLIVAGTDDDLWQSYLSDNLAGRLRTSSRATCGTTPLRVSTST